MEIEGYLRPQLDQLNSIFAESVREAEIHVALTKALDSISRLEQFPRSLPKKEETFLYVKAIEELQYSLLLVSVGNYRHAYSSLRLFFELFLAGVEFGVNLRYLRAWKLGKDDIFWSRLSDDQDGVLSKNFCALFFPELADESKHFRSIAVAVYRECSEFVHGNPRATSSLPVSLQFKKETVLDWSNKLDTMCLVITFVLAVRYLPELTPENREPLKETMLDQLGHLTPIRDELGGVIGG
ncbi:MAG: hypothetical protein OEL53_01665 [Rhodospirillales bacterium]|nr:hypothetical protein [Rhodospirillales bacterium]